MGKRQRDCARCGAPVGLKGRDLCCMCTRRDKEEAAKSQCAACGQQRVLDPRTSRCVRCSRRCSACDAPVLAEDTVLCGTCRRKAAIEAAKSLCPRCGKPGFVRPETGWCGSCSRPGPARKPPRICVQCASPTNHPVNGLCSACWQRHPDRAFVRAANLASELGGVPAWFDGFVAHVAQVHCPSRAAAMISSLGKLLADGSSGQPQALLERSRRQGRSMGSLARALEHYFTASGLAIPTDNAEVLAAGRRHRRIDAVPEHLRPAVNDFAESLLASKARARRAHTRPRTNSTIESAISTVRDLSLFLNSIGKDDWSLAATADIEAFIAHLQPGSRTRSLTVIRHFFSWARTSRLVLVNPAKDVQVKRRRGFTGKTLTIKQQQILFRRWTRSGDAHPHEQLVGLLALLHGASSLEARTLTMADIDEPVRAIRLGSRPGPTPLDPATWTALQLCLQHRDSLRTVNPHVIVTRGTKAHSRPASSAYLSHVLDPAGISPKAARVTRLAELVNSMDPKLVAAAFGLNPGGVLDYLADHVDEARLHELAAN